jgi:hypothetical protein
MNIPYVSYVHAILWVAAGVGAVLLFRRFGGAAPLLLVIGTVGFLILQVVESIGYQSPEVVMRHATFSNTVDRIARLGTLCLPVGIVWLGIRLLRRT